MKTGAQCIIYNVYTCQLVDFKNSKFSVINTAKKSKNLNLLPLKSLRVSRRKSGSRFTAGAEFGEFFVRFANFSLTRVSFGICLIFHQRSMHLRPDCGLKSGNLSVWRVEKLHSKLAVTSNKNTKFYKVSESISEPGIAKCDLNWRSVQDLQRLHSSIGRFQKIEVASHKKG